MATIKLKVTSNFEDASNDLKQFGDLTTTEAKRAAAAMKKLDGEQLDNFTRGTARATAAVKATRGPTAALQKEYYSLRTQIEKMIKSGIDPMDDSLVSLRKQYKKLDDQLESTRKEQKKLQDQQEQSKKIMGALKVAAVAAGAAMAAAFLAVSLESAEAASDAEEIAGKFSVVFADISDDATGAAKTIADDFDLAASTVNKLLGDTGDILTGLGFDQKTALDLSKQVGTLALDLASFTNFAGGAEGASAALTKALLGEAESAKALGIVIRQDTAEYKDLVSGLMETNDIGLVQAKALAALQIATEQSKNAIGDYARTSESAANVSKTLEEQTKRLKEEYGKMVLNGLTPARAALRGMFSDIADNIAATNLFRDVTKDLSDGILDEERSLEDLETSLDKVEKFNRSQSGHNRFKQEEASLRALIAAYGIQDSFLEKERGRTEALAREEQNKADQAQAAAEMAAKAAAAMETRRVSALSSEEKQIEALQTQIDYWSQYRDITGTQELLNGLISDRNALLDEQKAKQDALNTEETTDSEQEYNITPYADFLNAKFELQQENAFKSMEVINSITDAEAKAAADRTALKKAELSASADLFGSLSALVTAFGKDNEAAMNAAKALASTQAAINSYLAFTQVLADHTIPSTFVKVLAAGSVLASGLAQQANIWSAETGGSFTVPRTTSAHVDNKSVAVSEGEEVNVTPRGGNSSSSTTVNVMVDKQIMWSVIQEGLDQNEITVSNDNLRAG